MDERGGGSARGGGVLVVDDHAPIREFVRAALEGAGYAVCAAGDGAAALRMAQEARPAVILLDLRLPGMDGRQFLAAYRRGPGPHAPVVLMTAIGDTASYAAEVGADGHLGKPFKLADLLAVVGRLWGRKTPAGGMICRGCSSTCASSSACSARVCARAAIWSPRTSCCASSCWS